MMLLFLIFILLILVASFAEDQKEEIRESLLSLRELKHTIYPHLNNHRSHHHHNQSLRRLATSDGSVACTVCQGLTTCSILNGYLIEEVYYPNNLNYLQTCKVFDELGSRLTPLIFGDGKTFRDTAQCRSIVMQYLCLFYGSDNYMYRNNCVNEEKTSDPNPANHKVAPRPPCRSFCVQTAGLCANEPDYFVKICSEIACPPVEDECTPDPFINGETLAANLGCAVPYYTNPYFSAASRFTIMWSMTLLFTLSATIFIAW